MKEIKLNINSANQAISSYKKIIDSMKKSYDDLKRENLEMRNRWNGKSAEAFNKYSDIIEKNLLARWEKFIEDMQKINDSFAGILNVTSIQLQEKCDAFEELIKK